MDVEMERANARGVPTVTEVIVKIGSKNTATPLEKKPRLCLSIDKPFHFNYTNIA